MKLIDIHQNMFYKTTRMKLTNITYSVLLEANFYLVDIYSKTSEIMGIKWANY